MKKIIISLGILSILSTNALAKEVDVKTICEDGYQYKIFTKGSQMTVLLVRAGNGDPVLCGERKQKYIDELNAYIGARTRLIDALIEGQAQILWCQQNIEGCRRCDGNLKNCEAYKKWKSQ